MNNLKFSIKIGLSFAMVILVTAAAMMFNFQRLSTIETTEKKTLHTHEVLEQLSTIMAAMVDQETGLRAYLLAGEEVFLDPFVAGGEAYARAFSEVNSLTSDNAALQKQLEELDQHAQAWRVDHAMRLIEMMKRVETREQARAADISGAGKAAMDGIRKLKAEIERGERDLLKKQKSDSYAAIDASYSTIAATLLGLVIIATVSGFMLYRAISVPVVAMTQTMSSLAAGEMQVEVPGVGRKDEIGAMASAVAVFKQNAIERKHLEDEARAKEAQSAEEKRRAMQELADQFEATVGGLMRQLSSSSTELEATARSLSSTAEETNVQSASVASTAEQTAANVQAVATATEQLAASAQEIGGQVAQTAMKSASAVEQARETNGLVTELTESAQKIGEVIAMISAIAEQTNLLALNATIEAARAGEAGKGFAVVAAEVKGLADQTAKATEEISSQITGMQGISQKSVTAIGAIAHQIEEMSALANSVAAAVEEQQAATSEISRNVAEAARGTQESTSNISQVREASSHTASASEQLLTSANELSENAGTLETEVSQFLERVRAG